MKIKQLLALLIALVFIPAASGATAEGAAGLGDRSVAYVSSDGSDDNDGTAAAPFATVNRALSAGASSVLMYGGTYVQQIDLALSAAPVLSISPVEPTQRVVFEGSDSLVCAEETPVEGHTGVYSAFVDRSFSDKVYWLFQDGVSEEATLIRDDQRHPLQRGLAYRCEDTRLYPCTAEALEEALSKLEESPYKWFYDAGDRKLYFSRPQPVTPENPLRADFSMDALFLNPGRDKTLLLTGIETRYLRFNLDGTVASRVTDCKSSNVVAEGAFSYGQSVGTEFIRCEACHTNYGSNGDGFNAHSDNRGEPFAKQTTATFIDCWSHDNHDDGYSDHERCETTIIGGLYEWNRKGGVVPAFGSHCTCYNVTSRHNFNGFLYTGTVDAAEGGAYGQLVCVGCVAEYNTAGGAQMGFYVRGKGNRMLCVDCRSISNEYGYGADEQSYLKLIDCTGFRNRTADKGGTLENITVENTVPIE